jgi:hypothetical protein
VRARAVVWLLIVDAWVCAGKKARREAEKLQRSRQEEDAPTLSSVHSRRLLQLTTNSSNATAVGEAELQGVVKGTLSFRFKDVFGCCTSSTPFEITDDLVYTVVKEWIRALLNADPTINPDGLSKAPYSLDVIKITKVAGAGGDTTRRNTHGSDMSDPLMHSRHLQQNGGSNSGFNAGYSNGGFNAGYSNGGFNSGNNAGYGDDEFKYCGTCKPGVTPPGNNIWPCDQDGCDSGDYAEATVEISVEVVAAKDREKTVALLSDSLLTSPLALTGSSFTGLFPGDQNYTQEHSRWVTQPYAVFCGDGVLQPDTEHCDEGNAMSDVSSCSNCRCNSNTGFAYDAETNTCMCSTNQPDPLMEAVETSSVQGLENNLTFAVELKNGVIGVKRLGKNNKHTLPSPVVVTISGLHGATAVQSEPGVVAITCRHAMPNVWTDGCKLGLVQLKTVGPFANETDWRYGFAQWNQTAGTLRFAVLGPLAGGGSQSLERTFHLSFTVTNAPSVQRERRPEVSVCAKRAANAVSSYRKLGIFDAELARGNDPLSDTGYILGANAKRLDASTQNQTVEFMTDVTVQGSTQTETQTVLRVTVPGGSMPPNSELIVYGQESEVDRGLVRGMDRRIPFREHQSITSVLAGKAKTMVKLTLRDKATKQTLAFNNDEVRVEIEVDTPLVRVRGGCYTPESNVVTVCLAGYVGLYKYDDSGRGWHFIPDVQQRDAEAQLPAHASRMYTRLESKVLRDVSSSTSYVVLTTPPCNDYMGSGRAGGDMVCLTASSTHTPAYATLGGGTISKMPAIEKTSRPAFASHAALLSYSDSMTGGNVQYTPRKSWQKVDLSRWTKVLPARFGHATATVSGSRVLIYGGIGCLSMDVQNASSSGFCLNETVLNDVWEFDLVRWTKSGSPLELLNLSPVLLGRAGPSLIVLPGEDHRVLTVGGSSVLYPLAELMKRNLNRTRDSFEYRELEFRASKVSSTSVDTFKSISSASVARNATHIILVAGYLANTRTQAVHTYEVDGSSPELALNSLLIVATGPSARSKPGVIKPDGTTLLMYGGIVEDKSDVGTTKQRALGDLWEFDLNTQAWARVHDTLSVVTPRAFGAFGSFEVDSQTILFTYGGLLKGFHSQLTFRGAGATVDYQVSSEGLVYMASLRNIEVFREAWTNFRPKVTGGTKDCCNYKRECEESKRGIGCNPVARAFQTMEPGHFVAGKQSMIMFGGLDKTGKALGDLWYLDVDDRTEGKDFWIILSNITSPESFTSARKHVFEEQVKRGWGMSDAPSQWEPTRCNSPGTDTANANIVFKEIDMVPQSPETVSARFTTTQAIFDNCVRPVMVSPGALERAVNGTAMQGVLLNTADQIYFSLVTEYRMPWYQYRSNEWCKAGKCLRALCQSKIRKAQPDSSDPSRLTYCFDDTVGDGDNNYFYTRPSGAQAQVWHA